MYKDKQILGCISDAKYAAYDNTGTGLSATNAQDAISELIGKLKAKIQIAEITGKTGTGGSVGILTIPRSSYPNTVVIIPLGYATNSSIQVGGIKITDTDFLFAVQDSITNAWIDSKTVTFMGALIE